MSSDWIKLPLAKLGKIITGKTPSTKNSSFFFGDIPFVTPSDMDGRKVIDQTKRCLSNLGAKSITKTLLPEGTVMVSCIGSDMGKVALSGKKHCATNQQINSIVIDNEQVCKEYVYYNLSLRKEELKRLAGGSAQPILNKSQFSEVTINLPSLSEQKNISLVLKSFDDKIELNNRINFQLENMAKTLYDYWFVQFDYPDALGKPYKTSGGEMVYNEELKKEIPKGWDTGSLLEIANFTNGLPCQKFRPTGTDVLKVIKIKEMHEGFSAKTEFVRADIPEKVIIENGDILFSWSASLEVQVWSKGRGALNQHIFKVTSTKYAKYFYYYQLLNYLQHFKMMAENRKTTMGHITQEHLQQSRIVLPPKELTIKLEKIISPIFNKKINNEIENQKLLELKDWLLPMLINGQINVS